MNPLDPLKTLEKQAAENRQVLSEQQIRAASPGTILSDMETLLGFIGVSGLATHSNRGNLPNAVLAELNTRMSKPLELRLRRAMLRDYPNVAGLYVLARVMNLVRADEKRICVDDDHLYEFRYRDQNGKLRVYNHYGCEEGPHANEIRVGEMHLPEKEAIKFLFDFGDSWRFLVRFERLDPPSQGAGQITVTDFVGDVPKQYPDIEE